MKLLLLSLFVLTSCGDSQKDELSILSQSRQVKCYSGGIIIYEGRTTSKISNEKNSDGYYFMDTNGQFIEINAECIFTK